MEREHRPFLLIGGAEDTQGIPQERKSVTEQGQATEPANGWGIRHHKTDIISFVIVQG
jgi:hypothetical protein